MESPMVSTRQKRKASVSHASGPTKRTRSVSISVKVTHAATTDHVIGTPELPVVPKNSQASLGGIPEEILLNIVKYLHQNRRALAMLCRTDRRCKRVAEEVLYKNISGLFFNYDNALAVASNPLLAHHVRTFDAAFADTMAFPPSRKRQPVNAETIREINTRVLASAHKIQDLAILESRHWGSKGIELARTLGWLELFNDAVAKSFDGLANRFAQLKKLTINSHILSVEEISCVFRLPSLESLFLWDVHQTTPFKNWPIPASSSPIQEFVFKDAMMDISAVVQMIHSVKALRKFRYDHSTKAWEPFGEESNLMSFWPEHSWKLLGDALRTHRNSLEELHSFNHCDKALLDIVYPDGRDVGTLGSFRDFPKLEYCGVPIEAFLDIATGEDDFSLYLPPRLRRWYTTISPRTARLLERCASPLASLRDVVCVAKDKIVRVVLFGKLPFRALKLSRDFAVLEEAGITLKIRYNHARVTLDDLRVLESDDDDDSSNEESDEDQQDEADEAEGEELADAVEEDNSGTQNGFGPTT